MEPMVDVDPAFALILAKPLHAVVGINRPGKAPHLSVVWFEWDGAVFRFSTRRSRVKASLLSRDSRVSILVDDPETNSYVCAFGTARIAVAGHARLAARLRAAYLPDEPDSGPAEEDRVVVTITPERLFGGT